MPDSDTVPIPKNNNNGVLPSAASLSESDSFPESPYVSPFPPGGSRPWGNVMTHNSAGGVGGKSPFQDESLLLDAFNVADERNLGHRWAIYFEKGFFFTTGLVGKFLTIFWR